MSVIIACLVFLGLTACGSSGKNNTTTSDEGPDTTQTFEDELYEKTIKLQDGRVVVCVVFIGSKKGGLSCDFSGATKVDQ